MKIRLIIFYFLLFCSSNLFSQNVGIGTNDPKAKLEISENSTWEIPHLLLHENGNDWARLRFDNTNTSRYWELRGYNSSYVGNDVFVIQNDEAGTLLSIEGNGAVGIGVGIDAHARFHIKENERVLFGADTIGSGDKLMWLPDLHAFRVGTVDGSGSEFWNRDSIGLYSFASGYNTKATAFFATAMGRLTKAKGNYSTAMGNQTEAIGRHSFAIGSKSIAAGQHSTSMGLNSKAEGYVSIAMGYFTKAEGDNAFSTGYLTYAKGKYSTAMGYNSYASQDHTFAVGHYANAKAERSTAMGTSTLAESYNSTAIGSYNLGGGDPTNWNDDDPILEVGIGQSAGTRNNALTILKDGRHGIMTYFPKANLHVAKDGTIGSGTIVAVLESKVSNRPILQFSETSIGDANSGMSIEYDGSGSGANNKMYINNTNGAPMVTFENGGQVGIGVVSPTFALHLPDNSVTGKARAHSWTTYSDERIKSDEQDINYGLREIMLLKPLSYNQHQASFENSELQVSDESENTIGFFAQALHDIIPEAVIKPADENEQLWGMDYDKLIPVLIKGMQEQQEEIEFLKEEIKQLKNRNKNQNNAMVHNSTSLFSEKKDKK